MKQQMITEITGKLSTLGVGGLTIGSGADIMVFTEFLDAGWNTGSKKVVYEASVLMDESSRTVLMWEKTTETGHGLSFGGDSGSSFQNGTTLFRKVKSVQFGPDGKAYEYILDLGAIPKTVKETAKRYNWKFKTVLSRNKASYPPGYIPQNVSPPPVPTIPQNTTSPAVSVPVTSVNAAQVTAATAAFCSNCGMPLPDGANFCQKCGLPIVKNPAGDAVLTFQPSGTPSPGSSVPATPPNPAISPEAAASQYTDSQGAFYAQGRPAPPLDKNGKPSVVSSVVFWIFWSLISLLCLIMLADEFSVFRLLGLALVIGLPLMLRKRLFKNFAVSLIGWVLLIIVFGFILGVTGQSGRSSQENDPNWAVQKQGNLTVALLKGVLPENRSVGVTKDTNPPSPQMDGIVLDVYDIVLPQGNVMEGVADIKLPYDKSKIPFGADPEDVLAAAYFDPGHSRWTALPFIVDKPSGSITVLTDHFSKYAVVYFKDGRKKLTETIPEFDSMPLSVYSDAELEQIVAGMTGGGSNAAALTAGWNQFNTYYGLTGAAGNILGAAVDSKTLNQVNNLMTEAGMGFAFAQVALDIYNGDKNAAVNNFVKNAAYYSASKWGGSALNLASAGVTFMDIALNKFAETALDKNLQKWEDAYRHYYETNPKVKRSAVDWYKIVATLHKDSAGPDDFKQKMSAAIEDYAQLFWKDAEGYAYVADSTPGLRGFGAGGEYAQGVADISKRYQQFLYGTTMKSVMSALMKKICLQEFRKAEARFRRLKDEMNKVYTIRVNLANARQVANLNGASVKFVNADGKVVHSQSFDASGRVGVRTTLFGFLKAGSPNRVQIKIPAQDGTPELNTTLSYTLNSSVINLNVPYSPLEKPQATPVAAVVNRPSPRVETRPSPSTAPPVVQQPKPEPTKVPPTPEYNYNAALAAWAADFAAEVNRRQYDDGVCKTTSQFEWVMGPVIKNGQVIGASRIWQTNSFYAGEQKGRVVRFTSNEAFSANNPGVYISLGELKRKYPQFGK